jgi:hypothetical protein
VVVTMVEVVTTMPIDGGFVNDDDMRLCQG